MAKILFSICGIGFGHAGRSQYLIEELSKKHEIKITTYEAGEKFLKKFKPAKLKWFELIYKNGEYNEPETITRNAPKITEVITHNYRVFKKIMKEFDPDIIVSDYEAFSLYMAKLFGKKSILLSNMHSLKQLKTEKLFFQNPATITGTFWLLPFMFFDKLIILQLNKKEPEKNTIYVRMILRKKVRDAKPINGKKVIVYSNPQQLKTIIPVLEQIKEQKFIVFGYEGKETKNIIFHKKYSQEKFLKELTQSKAVMCHGGYTLITEALYLKKPIYVFTSPNFFERYFNGTEIQKLGFGTVEKKPTVNGIKKFLEKNSEYKKNVKTKWSPPDNEKVVNLIDNFARKNAKQNLE
jgi:uncharacterized protein (TIGR00661 family)